MGEIKIESISAVTPELVRAVSALVPQLSESAVPCSEEQLAEIARSPATTLFVARADDTVTGMLTLICYRVPTGVKAMIEDVVVDQRYRGQGIAEALTRAALDLARSRGARAVDLTSRPSRAAANRLYQRLGFQQRDTNAYRFRLDRAVQ